MRLVDKRRGAVRKWFPVGAQVAQYEVLAQPPQDQAGVLGAEDLMYRVRRVCCDTETEVSQAALSRLRGRPTRQCRACYLAVRKRPRAGCADAGGRLSELAPVRRRRELAERAARVAAMRAANAAKTTEAHALAIAAPPPFVLSSDELRHLRARHRRARTRRKASLAVTPGFEGHPRTIDEVLRRAELRREGGL